MSLVAYVCICVFSCSHNRGFEAGGDDDGRRAVEEGWGGLLDKGFRRISAPVTGFESAAGRWTADTGTRRKYKVEQTGEKNEGVKKYIIIILADTLLVLTLTGWSVVRRRQQGLMGESGMSAGAGLHSTVGAALHLNMPQLMHK